MKLTVRIMSCCTVSVTIPDLLTVKREIEGSSHIRLGLVKPQSKSSIPNGDSAAEPDSSMLLKAKPVEPVSFYP
jgi:hypothetical protein